MRPTTTRPRIALDFVAVALVLGWPLTMPISRAGTEISLTYETDSPPPVSEVYRRIGDLELVIERYDHLRPKGPRRPAIVFFHGSGSRDQFAPLCRHFAERGMVALTADYRLESTHNATPIECLDNARAALRWVRQNADRLGVDPERIAGAGGSFGGYLAAACALVPSHGVDEGLQPSFRPDALVLFDPVFDNGPRGGGHDRIGNRYEEFSPMHNIAAGAPPTIVFFGTADRSVPVTTVQEFDKRMKAAGARCETHHYERRPPVSGGPKDRDGGDYLDTLKKSDAFLASLGWLEDPAGANTEDPRLNVLFIVCDDLNCDLGCYGDATASTPNIDRLAARGRRFSQAHCNFPLCGPSRASLLTGLTPDQTGMRANGLLLRDFLPGAVTLPQAFRRAGYEATRIGKLFHYNNPGDIGTAGHDDPTSWDRAYNPAGSDKRDESKIFTLLPGRYGATLSWLRADGKDGEQTDGLVASKAIDLLGGYAATRRPFFLAVGFYRPHTPYVAPAEYYDRHPLSTIRLPAVEPGYLSTLPSPAVWTLNRWPEQNKLSPDLAREATQAYHATISFVDAQVGRVLDTLDATGLSHNTVVVLTSDHGYHMGQHGYYQKGTLFEEATRVPLILAGPGVAARGVASESFAELIDLYPTLTKWCRVEAPVGLAGQSLVPILKNTQASVRDDVLTQVEWPVRGYTLRTRRYRYTEWGPRGAKGRELYDRSADPQEMHNLAESADPVVIDRLSQRLVERITPLDPPSKPAPAEEESHSAG